MQHIGIYGCCLYTINKISSAESLLVRPFLESTRRCAWRTKMFDVIYFLSIKMPEIANFPHRRPSLLFPRNIPAWASGKLWYRQLLFYSVHALQIVGKNVLHKAHSEAHINEVYSSSSTHSKIGIYLILKHICGISVGLDDFTAAARAVGGRAATATAAATVPSYITHL